MRGLIFKSTEDSSSNAGSVQEEMCVDGKIHMSLSLGWYDQTGAEDSAYDSETWIVTGPCNGACGQNTRGLPAQAEALALKFLSSGECGEWEHTKPRYSVSQLEEIEASYSRTE